MKLPKGFAQMPVKTLFMSALNSTAVLVTRTGNRMRRRKQSFADAHAALDYCLVRRAAFVLVPANPDLNLN